MLRRIDREQIHHTPLQPNSIKQNWTHFPLFRRTPLSGHTYTQFTITEHWTPSHLTHSWGPPSLPYTHNVNNTSSAKIGVLFSRSLLRTPHSHPHLHAQDWTSSWRQLPSLQCCWGHGRARPPSLAHITNTQGFASHTCSRAPLAAPWEVYWLSQRCFHHLEAHTYFETRDLEWGAGRWTGASVRRPVGPACRDLRRQPYYYHTRNDIPIIVLKTHKILVM